MYLYMAWVIRPLVFWCGILLHVLNISTLLSQTNGITWASFCFLPCFYLSRTILLYLKRVASLVSLVYFSDRCNVSYIV